LDDDSFGLDGKARVFFLARAALTVVAWVYADFDLKRKEMSMRVRII
jgi:hypothetical protein